MLSEKSCYLWRQTLLGSDLLNSCLAAGCSVSSSECFVMVVKTLLFKKTSVLRAFSFSIQMYSFNFFFHYLFHCLSNNVMCSKLDHVD